MPAPPAVISAPNPGRQHRSTTGLRRGSGRREPQVTQLCRDRLPNINYGGANLADRLPFAVRRPKELFSCIYSIYVNDAIAAIRYVLAAWSACLRRSNS